MLVLLRERWLETRKRDVKPGRNYQLKSLTIDPLFSRCFSLCRCSRGSALTHERLRVPKRNSAKAVQWSPYVNSETFFFQNLSHLQKTVSQHWNIKHESPVDDQPFHENSFLTEPPVICSRQNHQWQNSHKWSITLPCGLVITVQQL